MPKLACVTHGLLRDTLIIISSSQDVKGLQMNSTGFEKRAFSVEEAAHYIGVTRPTVYRLLGAAELPSLHIGRRRMILKEDLDQFLNDRRLAPGA